MSESNDDDIHLHSLAVSLARGRRRPCATEGLETLRAEQIDGRKEKKYKNKPDARREMCRTKEEIMSSTVQDTDVYFKYGCATSFKLVAT